MKNKCGVCGATDGYEPFVVREMMFGTRELFDYQRCRTCGSLQITRVPTDLARHYPAEGYYSLGQSVVEKYRHPLKGWVARQRTHYATGHAHLGGRWVYRAEPREDLRSLRGVAHPETRLLDVGCGNGSMLHHLAAVDFRNLTGTDPFAQAAQYANGVTIMNKPLSDVRGTWELITMHHALEHVPDPLETLRAARARLTDSGTCLVRLPVANTFAEQYYGPDWVQLDAPRHLHVPSERGMRTLAERAGFSVARVVYDSTALQFWGSEQYRQDIPLRGARSYDVSPRQSPFSRRDLRIFSTLAERLNRVSGGDQAAFYLHAR